MIMILSFPIFPDYIRTVTLVPRSLVAALSLAVCDVMLIEAISLVRGI